MSSKRESKHQDVPRFTDEEVKQILVWNDPNRLHWVPLFLGLYHPKMNWAIGKCINLARHEDPVVRGNALRSFGYFAQRFHSAHRSLVEPLIQEGLRDKNALVREQAEYAAHEIEVHCTWRVTV